MISKSEEFEEEVMEGSPERIRLAKRLMNEIRVVNETTGGQKGQKDIRWDLVPIEPMQEVARLYHEGAKKYAKDNWRKGYDWSLSYAALQRHATQFWNGESYDSETGCHHLSSVVFHALAMMEFEKTHPELDDRYLAHLIKPVFNADPEA